MSYGYHNRTEWGKGITEMMVTKMQNEGLDVRLPSKGENGDAIITKPNGVILKALITARRRKAEKFATFAAFKHSYTPHYWLIFFSEALNKTWVMSSKEFISEASQNKKEGPNKGTWTIHLGIIKDEKKAVNPRYAEYLADNFRRLIEEDPD